MHDVYAPVTPYLLDLYLLVTDGLSESPSLRIGGEQLQADGAVEAFDLCQMLLLLFGLGVGHPEAFQQVPVLMLLRQGSYRRRGGVLGVSIDE